MASFLSIYSIFLAVFVNNRIKWGVFCQKKTPRVNCDIGAGSVFSPKRRWGV